MICTIGCEKECTYLLWEMRISSLIIAILIVYIIIDKIKVFKK